MRSIGLDVGTTSVKGVAVAADGAVLAEAERAYPLQTPRPGWSEQDPDLWWEAAQAVLHELGGAHADAIGLTGQMHGMVALDEADRPVCPAILWNDGRSVAQCEQIEREIGLERLIELTGNRALAGFTAPKILWLREHRPDLHARARTFMLPKDYVRLRLTGERTTDVADASGTLLFDVGRRVWSQPIVAALDVDPGTLPIALESPQPTGTTAAGVPVAAGAGDQAAGALGVGVIGPDSPVSVVLGTSGVVLAATDRHEPDPQARVHAFCHAAPGAWIRMGVMLSAAGSLRWLRAATAAAETPYDVLTAEAERWPPVPDGLMFAPYLTGERTPYPDADVRGAFVGLDVRHDRGALVRAVLEGVAYGLRDSLDLVAPDAAARGIVGRVSGGGAASDLWLDIVAAVLGVPLEVCATDAGAAFGAALLGGCAAGEYASPADAAAAAVRVTRTIEPRADWAAAYAEARPAYRALYPMLRR
jgi:xylulokinase